MSTGFLVCDRCLDGLNYQQSLLIIPPDPEPFYNLRPEPYAMDETNWLVTQSDEIITTQDGELFVTSIPNPQSNAATAHLHTLIAAPGGSVAVAYLDIFNGNPLGGGTSVLSTITGSPTRTNIASSLSTVLGIAKNPAQIIVAAESAATVNVNYVAIYDAATAGTLLMSGPAWVNGQSVTAGNPVVFDALAININLN